MNVKKLALIVTFAAVAVALNAFRIPVFFYPSNFFQFSQIVIVIAFFLFGVRVGVSIGVVNMLVSIVLLPLTPTGIITHAMDFISLFPMFAGLRLTQRFTHQSEGKREFSTKKKSLALVTAVPTAFRVMTMPFLDYGFVFCFLLPMFFGINYPGAAILALVPSFILYNLIVPLYTVPVAYIVTAKISSRYDNTIPRR